MKVPFLDLRPQLQPLHNEIVNAVINVIDSTQYIMGPEVSGLEEKIATYSRCQHHQSKY